LDEIEELVHRYGAREIRFFDDTFTMESYVTHVFIYLGRSYR